jgi:pectate lyase
VSADYTVSATIRILSTVTSPADLNLGLAGRMSTSADTYYALYYQAGETVLIKRIAGVTSPALDIWTSTLSTSTNYTFALEMVGTTIKGYVNDIERVSATDSDISAVGRGGLRANGINDYNTGNHVDNFTIEDTASDLVFRSYSVPIIGL